MARSKCAKCGGTRFEVELVELSGGNFKQNFVQCTSCGTPVGVLDFFNIGALLKDQEKEIKKLNRRLEGIEAYLQKIASATRR